jgi:hypothetical protein
MISFRHATTVRYWVVRLSSPQECSLRSILFILTPFRYFASIPAWAPESASSCVMNRAHGHALCATSRQATIDSARCSVSRYRASSPSPWYLPFVESLDKEKAGQRRCFSRPGYVPVACAVGTLTPQHVIVLTLTRISSHALSRVFVNRENADDLFRHPAVHRRVPQSQMVGEIRHRP